MEGRDVGKEKKWEGEMVKGSRGKGRRNGGKGRIDVEKVRKRGGGRGREERRTGMRERRGKERKG